MNQNFKSILPKRIEHTEADKNKSTRELILDALREKASNKQRIFRLTKQVFKEFKSSLKATQLSLKSEISKTNKDIGLIYSDNGNFESEIKFSGDVLIFSMHTNVFTFDPNHFIQKSNYVKEDPTRSYCGMIQVFNFLGDSFKFNRQQDIGYLVARIFINSERHFFVEGKRKLAFLYNDFENSKIDKPAIQDIIESVILYAIDFDLLVPPYEKVKQLTVQQKQEQSGTSSFQTGKRLGFRFESDSDKLK